jgi:hypothetical protein
MLSSVGCSKPFSMPKAAGMQLLPRIRNSPGALAPWGTRGLLTTTRCDEPASCNGVARFVKRSTREKSTRATWRIREIELLAAREAHFVARNES